MPNREGAAREAIDQAIQYAVAIGAAKVHVMAGFAQDQHAHDTFVANVRYACETAAPHDIEILIKPLNSYDAPEYFLQTTDQAVAIVAEVGAPNIRLMFDCYHVQLMEGDLTHKLEELRDHIGHIQFASVSDRGSPNSGDVNYAHVFGAIDALGYKNPLGADDKLQSITDQTLGWLYRQR